MYLPENPNESIEMALDPTKTLNFSPMLRLQWEETQNKHVILYPEGIVELNVPSTEILKLCDGAHNAEQILVELESKFNQTGLKDDIFGFLETAIENGWVN
jgi:pyrroloquinoline quinone biosynthesis protein D